MSQPFNQIKLSSIPGVVLDCVVGTGAKIGGGTPTDNTTPINNFFASLNTSIPTEVIWDGGVACQGVTLPVLGNVKIQGMGLGAGIYVLSGSNNDGINNTKIMPFDGGTAPTPKGNYIEINDITINGNRGNGTTGNSNSGNPRGVSGTWWYCGINLTNCDMIRINGVFIYDAPAYGIRLNNCSDVIVDDCTLYMPNTVSGFNNDGIHISGGSLDGRVSNCRIFNNGSDDGVALNSAEGFAGLIDRWTVSNNTFQLTYTGLRIYATTAQAASGVGRVVFANNTGSVLNAVVVGGFGGASGFDASGQAIEIADCVFQSQNGMYFALTGNLGDISFDNCVLNSPVSSTPWVSATSASTISNLNFNNCRTYRNTAGHFAPGLLNATTTCVIKQLTINNYQMADEAGQWYTAPGSLLAMTNVTITTLFLGLLNMSNLTTIADSYTNIGSVIGPGLGSQTSTKTAAYTLLPTDGTVFVDATSAAVSITLPAKQYAGHEVKVVKTDSSANAVTLVGTISGAASPQLATQYAKQRFETSGTVWYNV